MKIKWGENKNSDTIYTSEQTVALSVSLMKHFYFGGFQRCFCVSCRVSFASEQQDEGETNGNELLVELEGKDEKKERETNMWFSKV